MQNEHQAPAAHEIAASQPANLYRAGHRALSGQSHLGACKGPMADGPGQAVMHGRSWDSRRQRITAATSNGQRINEPHRGLAALGTSRCCCQDGRPAMTERLPLPAVS
jgi:hypothetical protein